MGVGHCYGLCLPYPVALWLSTLPVTVSEFLGLVTRPLLWKIHHHQTHPLRATRLSPGMSALKVLTSSIPQHTLLSLKKVPACSVWGWDVMSPSGCTVALGGHYLSFTVYAGRHPFPVTFEQLLLPACPYCCGLPEPAPVQPQRRFCSWTV